ncbi:MAG: peptidylprolyl isomerase [Notoacmeibacter sp.]|nr:peptidylprolyl isomerase [Notoacmeibacter sp.]
MTQPFRRLSLTLGTVLLAAGLHALPALGAEDTVVATVNGQPITEADLTLAEGDLDQQFRQLPEDQRRGAALSALIEIRLMASKAVEKGLDKDAEFVHRLAFLKERALHSAFVEKEVAATVTDEAVRARYDKEMADMKPANEVRARHILVKTEEEAKALIAELDAGKDFVELAKEKSTGPSGPNGGDLGYFRAGQMVPDFEAAAFAMEPGSYSKEPVKTQFGFHVIKLEDKRAVQPPAFDEVKENVKSLLLRETYFAMAKDIRKEAAVEVKDEALKAALDKMEAEK